MQGAESAIETVAVVGAGQAAQSFIEALRKRGYARRIVLIGEEVDRPYQRPPLSKGYLLGEMARERLYFRSRDFYETQDVTLRLGARATALDLRARKVTLADGEAVGFDRLLLATGARPRRLPEAIGGALAGVHVVRDLADVDAMAPAVVDGARAVIVGGGYIGLEAAAVAAKSGMRVALVESAPRILGRVASEQTAAYFTALHQRHGVEILTGAVIERLEAGPDGARVAAVRLADGRTLPADLVIVGIGVAPAVDLAEAAGLAIDNGIAVDARGRSSDPHVFAAGDCASFPYRGGRIRLESVQNAIDQAAAAAAAMLDPAAPAYEPTPWFWSDQYDVKLQIAGLSTGYDQIVERPGERDGARSVWYYRGGALAAVDAMNDPKAYMRAKRWLADGLSPDPAKIADPAIALADMV